MYKICQAKTKKDIIDFVKFPFKLYKNHPYWVPPIINDEVNYFNPELNLLLKKVYFKLTSIGTVSVIEVPSDAKTIILSVPSTMGTAVSVKEKLFEDNRNSAGTVVLLYSTVLFPVLKFSSYVISLGVCTKVNLYSYFICVIELEPPACTLKFFMYSFERTLYPLPPPEGKNCLDIV